MHETGDLECYAGLMAGCLIMPECSKSLCSVAKACEEHSLGYQVAEGNTGSSFTRGGKSVIELGTSGGMSVLPEDAVLPDTVLPEVLGVEVRDQQKHLLGVSKDTGALVPFEEPKRKQVIVLSQEPVCALVAGAGCGCSECEARVAVNNNSGERQE